MNPELQSKVVYLQFVSPLGLLRKGEKVRLISGMQTDLQAQFCLMQNLEFVKTDAVCASCI